MDLVNIANNRLFSQQIAKTNFNTEKDVVGWMGAMQAQDYAMVNWAIGVRLPDATAQAVQSAMDSGEIIRTHLLRPTWHLVSADDIYWMLELSAPQIKTSLKARHNQLELSKTILAKSNSILEKNLTGGKHLTREEILVEFEKARITLDDNRASHILLWAELEGIICSGAIKNGKQTYALLEERVPKPPSLTRDAALAKLAKTYFTSRCPATLQDFAWWSGLSVSDAKLALELTGSGLRIETIDSHSYPFPPSFSISKSEKESIYMLPAFDEFIISYKDRSAILPFENQKKTISNNGVFWPIIVINGQVKGIWKRTIKKENIIVQAQLFLKPDKSLISAIEKACAHFGSFLGKKSEIIVTTI